MKGRKGARECDRQRVRDRCGGSELRQRARAQPGELFLPGERGVAGDGYNSSAAVGRHRLALFSLRVRETLRGGKVVAWGWVGRKVQEDIGEEQVCMVM